MRKFKRILSLALMALLVVLTFSATGCGKKLTEKEAEAKIKELVDASYELNEIVYGKGLSYYDRIDTQNSLYAPVSDDEEYKSIGEIKLAIRNVFSSSYARVLEAAAFEGQDGADFGYHTQPRYIDQTGELMVLKDFYNVNFDSNKYGEYEGVRVQKYNTDEIEIVKISKRFVEGKIKSEDGKTTITVTLILEDDEWRLDSPTY
ncbi:MAG: hypothetical protein IJ437_00500 [Clostridia bacterium]|nr:hypothetical protein [Clostridia bacterium]